MIDLDAIRQALADAKPLYNETMVMSDSLADAIDSLYANAPVWLAALVSEVERLRAEQAEAFMAQIGEVQHDLAVVAWKEKADRFEAERDAARQNEASALFAFDKAAQERDAWRACADQLAAYLIDGYGADRDAEALAVYESLKGADS